MDKGLLHIYCGEGVGKTTASLGLALRAAGNNFNVIFAQFMKGSSTGEINALSKIGNITVLRNNIDFGFSKDFTEYTKQQIRQKHNETLAKICDKLDDTDMLILDEINSAYELNLIDRQLVDRLVIDRRDTLEIVMTGRNPHNKFLEVADYISEIKCIKHPFQSGVLARKGIEY